MQADRWRFEKNRMAFGAVRDVFSGDKKMNAADASACRQVSKRR
jgi:hypothetical protein